MSWSSPRTWATGDKTTIALLNQEIRDNILALYEPHSAGIENSADESIGNNANTNVTFDTENWDDGALHSVASNTERFTIVEAGKYVVGLRGTFAANATNARRWMLLHTTSGGGTTTELLNFSAETNGAGDNCGRCVETVFAAAVGDWFSCQVWQNSGGALNFQFTAYSPHAYCYRVAS